MIPCSRFVQGERGIHTRAFGTGYFGRKFALTETSSDQIDGETVMDNSHIRHTHPSKDISLPDVFETPGGFELANSTPEFLDKSRPTRLSVVEIPVKRCSTVIATFVVWIQDDIEVVGCREVALGAILIHSHAFDLPVI